MKSVLIFILVTVILVSGCLGQEIPEEDICSAPTGEYMHIDKAKQTAVVSECGNRLKDAYMCNENTGTWWIDLEIEKEGCNPAGVINVATGQAEINWRCTGALP